MRRLLRSLHGGIAATVFLFTLEHYLEEWPTLSDLLGAALVWPWTLWNYLFPVSCFFCFRRIVLPLGTNVLVFSAMTYAILCLSERRKLRTLQP